MRLIFRCSIFILLLLFLGSWYQRPLTFGDSYRKTDNYPVTFPRVVKPLSSDFLRDSTHAAALLAQLWDFYNFNQWENLRDSAKVLYQLGERLLEQKFNPGIFEYWALGYGGYGQAMVYLGDLEAGSSIMNECFAIRQRVRGESFLLAVEYYGAGHMALDLLDDPDLALDYYRTGEAIARKVLTPDSPNWFGGVRNLGRAYIYKGEYEKALKYYDLILRDSLCSKSKKQQTIAGLGSTFASVGAYDKALYYLLAGKPDDVESIADFRRKRILAETYLGLSRYEDCTRQLKECDRQFRRYHQELEKQGEAIKLCTIKSRLFAAQGRFSEAIINGKLAIELSDQQGVGKTSIDVLRLWQQQAEYFLKTERLEEAEYAVKLLLERETRLPPDESIAHTLSADLFSRQPYHLTTLSLQSRIWEHRFGATGNYHFLEAALTGCEIADTLIDRLRDTYRNIGSKNRLAGAAKPIYQQAIHYAALLWEHTGKAVFLEKAWAFSEKSKALGLLEALRDSEARSVVPMLRDDLNKESLVRRNLSFFENLLFEEQNKPTPSVGRISSLNRKIADLKNRQDSLIQVFKIRYPAFFRLKYDKQVSSLDDVRNKLVDSTAFIGYFLGDGELFSFLIDQGQTRLFRQKIDTNLISQIENLSECVHHFKPGRRTIEEKQRAFRHFTQASSSLFETLLSAPLRYSNANKLVIATDDVIGYVPFAALLTSHPAETDLVDYRILPYLIKERDVRLEYSGTLMRPSSGIKPIGGYLGVAPDYDGRLLAHRGPLDSLRFNKAFGALRGNELAALRFNRSEIQAAVKLLGGRHLEGREASEASFRKYVSDAGILHLAMHAWANDSDPLISTLAFSGAEMDSTGMNDGFLYAYEIYNLQLAADLVVLSACETGVGVVEKGEGIMSLARAFKYAGCSNIMMSLWSVNDYSAQKLITDFFQGLHDGRGKAEALREAQISFLQNVKDDELMHPYYWASWVMVGDNMPLPVSQNRWLLVTLLFLTISLIVLILKGDRNGGNRFE